MKPDHILSDPDGPEYSSWTWVRTIKPRKRRTLTEEGKAHAKAAREYPGDACMDCKRKKTKARDPLVAGLVFQHAYDRT